MLSQEFLEQVKLANNIVSVAGRYMLLKQKGRTHWGLCPFHHEKTSSFAINEQQQYYHCFGCGVSGNVVSLVRQLENVDFMGAIELLAKWANIKMPQINNDSKYLEAAKKKQKVLEIVEAAREYYCNNLYKTQGKPALEYLKRRGITDELIKLFNIGFSTDWNEVVSVLIKKGFSEGELVEAGVAAKNDKGKIYDAMGGRITFAIFDIYNNCIGFTGRILPEKDSGDTAKYRNTAQTVVFDKGSIVYGIDVLKKNKRSQLVDKLIVVEGNVDVISLVGAGFINTVACMGTAMTQFHAKVFNRFSDQIFICFDGDAAGQKATLRSLDILAAEGCKVRVIELPDKTDPDDFVKNNGKDAFQKLIDDAKPLIDFKLDYLEKTSNLKDNLGKTEYLKAAVDILKTVGSALELELYLPKVAKVSNISQESISKSLSPVKKHVAEAAVPVEIANQNSGQNAYQRALEFIVASKLHKKDYAKDKLDFEMDNKLYKEVIDKRICDIFDVYENEDLALLENVINYDFSAEDQILEKQYKDNIEYLTKFSLRKKRDELQKIYEATEDTDEKIKITSEIQKLNKRMKR